jgi:Mg-chelatase subunit ChlD
MPSWVRRPFTSPGLTQIPAGRHLSAVQGRYGGGVVMLCIDVSGSMSGRRLAEAVRGARAFVDEAVEARYKVGVVLWDTDVVDLEEPAQDGKRALKLLDRARSRGGTNLLPALERTHKVLNRFTGEPDRVVAIFGDGDLGPRGAVLAKVTRMKAEDIRFVARGLGASAAQEYAAVSSEEDADVEVGGVDELAERIAGMAASLKSRRTHRPAR